MLYYVSKRLDNDSLKKLSEHTENISIIIAVRNEEYSIKSLIQSILENNISENNYEIIIVDDHSEDQTTSQALSFEKTRVFSLPDGYRGKKQAILFGLQHAIYNNILVSDGDCVVGKDWVSMHLSALQNKIMNTGIVHIKEDKSLISSFQSMDVAATMSITKWGIDQKFFPLANGANMSYKKDVILDTDSLKNNLHIASGDDIFIAEKIFQSQPHKLGFISHPDAAVWTKSEPTWKNLLQQRIRWASKQTLTNSKRLLIFQITIGLYMTMLVALLLYAIIHPTTLPLWALLFGVKCIFDYFHLNQYKNIYKTPTLTYFLPASLIFPFFYVFLGIMAFLKKDVKWKGRPILPK